MSLKLPPRSAFPHAISYLEKVEVNQWGKATVDEPVVIERTRVDESYNFSRGSVNATEKMPNALIVMFKKYNKELPEFKTNNKILFRDKEFVIVRVVPLYFITTEIIGYELEVF